MALVFISFSHHAFIEIVHPLPTLPETAEKLKIPFPQPFPIPALGGTGKREARTPVSFEQQALN
jgi:hypothetical protein